MKPTIEELKQDEVMHSICLVRKPGFALARSYRVYINGELATRLAPYEKKEIAVKEKIIDIEVKIDWLGSKKESIDLEGISEIEIIDNKLYYIFTMLSAPLVILFLSIYNHTDNLWIEIIALVIFTIITVWIVYIFSFGRKNWMFLKKLIR